MHTKASGVSIHLLNAQCVYDVLFGFVSQTVDECLILTVLMRALVLVKQQHKADQL